MDTLKLEGIDGAKIAEIPQVPMVIGQETLRASIFLDTQSGINPGLDFPLTLEAPEEEKKSPFGS